MVQGIWYAGDEDVGCNADTHTKHSAGHHGAPGWEEVGTRTQVDTHVTPAVASSRYDMLANEAAVRARARCITRDITYQCGDHAREEKSAATTFAKS